MTRFRQTITSAAVATALLASLSLPSFAQTTAPADQPAAAQKAPEHHKHHHGEKRGGDRMEHMQKRMQERMAKLKADLKLTPAQAGAWTTYTEAMKPSERPAPGDREVFAKLTTPQRIDKMREMRAKRDAEMDRRADATKAFYGQLSADQQKTFDATSLRMHKNHGQDHHGHHGGKLGQERPAPAPAAK